MVHTGHTSVLAVHEMLHEMLRHEAPEMRQFTPLDSSCLAAHNSQEPSERAVTARQMSDCDRDQEQGEGLEAAFDAATQYVEVASSSGTLADTHLLRFYGLYKQATAGACTAPKPSLFDRRGRAKWHAWQACSALSSSQAQKQYVELLTEAAPGWAGAASSGGGSGAAKRSGGAGGAVQSRMAEPSDDDGEVHACLQIQTVRVLVPPWQQLCFVGDQLLLPPACPVYHTNSAACRAQRPCRRCSRQPARAIQRRWSSCCSKGAMQTRRAARASGRCTGRQTGGIWLCCGCCWSREQM